MEIYFSITIFMYFVPFFSEQPANERKRKALSFSLGFGFFYLGTKVLDARLEPDFFPLAMHFICTMLYIPGLISVEIASVWKAVKREHGLTCLCMCFIALPCEQGTENDKNEDSNERKHGSKPTTLIFMVYHPFACMQ